MEVEVVSFENVIQYKLKHHCDVLNKCGTLKYLFHIILYKEVGILPYFIKIV